MTSLRSLLLTVVCVAAPVAADAQAARPRQEPVPPVVPQRHMPPAGKCRIWMEGVAPAQQPAPTDCQTALRQKPANGTVIFGPTERSRSVTPFRSRTTPAAPAAPATRDSTASPDSNASPGTQPQRAPTPSKSAERPS